MSAIGGYFAAFPTPDGERILADLAEGLAARGPDGCRTVVRGPVGMVYRPFHTTPESRFDQQPILGREGELLAWDGRLDDIDIPDGESETGAPAPRGEAESVLAAYRRRGADFADALTGDFAAALWDPHRRRLLLATDPFGTRPLFYTEDFEGRLLWASNLTALRRAGRVEPTLDERWIAGYLGFLLPEGRTVFESIRRLPAGHVLLVDERGHHLRRYWPGRSIRKVRCADDREYEERFVALLRESVERRLRTSGPVFAELSGGVDSSSIVCVAHELLRERAASAEGLHTCSYVFEQAASSDESEFIREVETLTGGPRHRIDDREAPLLADVLSTVAESPTSLTTFQARYRVLARHMRSAGARVVLSGVAGDDLGVSEVDLSLMLVDDLAAGEPRALLRRMRDLSRELGQPWISIFWSGVALPTLPSPVEHRLTALSQQRVPWVGKDFAARTGFYRRLAGALPGGAERAVPLPSARRRCAGLRGTVAQQIEPRYLDTELFGYEMWFPFLHRPLVELCLGLPMDQLVRPRETRSIHRRALREVLPPKVAQRRTKQGPDEALMRAVGREWPLLRRLFAADARIFERGFVEREPFLTALERYRFGLVESSAPVFRAIDLEVWLRAFDAGSLESLTAVSPAAGTSL